MRIYKLVRHVNRGEKKVYTVWIELDKPKGEFFCKMPKEVCDVTYAHHTVWEKDYKAIVKKVSEYFREYDEGLKYVKDLIMYDFHHSEAAKEGHREHENVQFYGYLKDHGTAMGVLWAVVEMHKTVAGKTHYKFKEGNIVPEYQNEVKPPSNTTRFVDYDPELHEFLKNVDVSIKGMIGKIDAFFKQDHEQLMEQAKNTEFTKLLTQ